MVDTPLTLCHQSLITDLCSTLSIPLSEYNFANLYLFREVHHPSLIEVSPSVYAIKGLSYEKTPYLMPLFHPTDWKSVTEIAKDLNLKCIFPIPEMWFKQAYESGFSIDVSDNDSDYVFESDIIRTYRGRHLDGQRNLIRNLLSEHRIRVKDLTQETFKEALEVLDGWACKRNNESQRNEIEACRESIEQAKVLGLQGWVYEIDDLPAGLLIGGELTPTMYLIHFSKTSRTYRGLSTFMYQNVASRIDQRYTLLNWEQDLGIEGLRHAKQSYHPSLLAKKGRIWVT